MATEFNSYWRFRGPAFGSAMPSLDPAAGLGLLQDSEVSRTDQRRILHDNAAKLFNLHEIEEAA